MSQFMCDHRSESTNGVIDWKSFGREWKFQQRSRQENVIHQAVEEETGRLGKERMNFEELGIEYCETPILFMSSEQH